MRKKIGRKKDIALFTAIFTAVATIIASLIGIIPDIYKSKSQEVIVKFDKYSEKEREFLLNKKDLPKPKSKDDICIIAIMKNLARYATLKEGINVKGSTTLENDKIRDNIFITSSSVELSEHLFLRSYNVIKDWYDYNYHVILQIMDNSSFSEIYELKDENLVKKPDYFSYIDLERYLTASGFYVKSIKRTLEKDKSQLWEIIISYPLGIEPERLEIKSYVAFSHTSVSN